MIAKEQKYYCALYDTITIRQCRMHENAANEVVSKQDASDDDPDLINSLTKMISRLSINWYCAKRFKDKESTVRGWREEDEKKDSYLRAAKCPAIRCVSCNYMMRESFREFHNNDKGPDFILFFLECPNKCLPKLILFDNGKEYVHKPHTCEICGAFTNKQEKTENEKIISIYSCTNCGHISESVLDMAEIKENVDPLFEADRARFCLTGKHGEETLADVENLEKLARLMEDEKENEAKKDLLDQIKKIERLTVKGLEARLKEVLGKSGYIDLSFEMPGISKDIFVPFLVYESIDKNEDENVKKFMEVIKIALFPTNWRLVKDTVNYRLGLITGKLRGYDRKEDLLKIAKEMKAPIK